jgi:hypothetical protein
MSTAIAQRSPRTLRASEWRSGAAAHEGDDWPLRELLTQDFRVNRRGRSRWPVAGGATLLGLGADLGKVVELDDLVGAPWWLSGTAHEAISAGTKVSIGFSDPAARPASGMVVRAVRQGDDAWRIAVRFDDA